MKRRTKRMLSCLFALLVLPALAALPVSAAETAGAEASFWEGFDFEAMRDWFTREVLPHLVTVLTVLGVSLVELIPAIRSLIRAKGAFGKVAADVEAYNRAKIEYDLRTEERERAFEGRMEEMQAALFAEAARLEKTAERLDARLTRLTDSAEKTERMAYLAFTNAGELVTNGAARKISEIEEERADEAGTESIGK